MLGLWDNQVVARGFVQLSRLPGGGRSFAPLRGSLHAAVELVVGHYQSHAAYGGYVGIAPIGRGVVVQLHAADGTIESWRIIREA